MLAFLLIKEADHLKQKKKTDYRSRVREKGRQRIVAQLCSSPSTLQRLSVHCFDVRVRTFSVLVHSHRSYCVVFHEKALKTRCTLSTQL